MDDHHQETKDTESEFTGFTIEEMEKKFKALTDEIKNGGTTLGQLVTHSQDEDRPTTKIPYFRGYNPNVTDFLARASTLEECEEIIVYCLSRSEIDKDEAEQLRNRLGKGGPKAFGIRKVGYYDKKV